MTTATASTTPTYTAIKGITFDGDQVYYQTGTPPNPVPTPSGRNYLVGFYRDGATTPPYHTWLGYYPEYNYGASYQEHQAGGSTFPPSVLYPIMFDFDIYSNGTTMDYATVAAGGFDAQIKATLASIPTNYLPYIYALRIDSEFNLQTGYTAAGMTPSIYQAAWNHYVTLAKSVLPSRVKYIWNPNVTNGGDLSAYVPSSCDAIGIDAYTNAYIDSAYIFSPSTVGGLPWWTNVAKGLNKPIGLCEWGYGVGSADAGTGTFITAVGQWANNVANNVAFLGYWDSGDSGTVAMNAVQQAAFTTQFANLSYTGTFFTPTIATSVASATTLGF